MKIFEESTIKNLLDLAVLTHSKSGYSCDYDIPCIKFTFDIKNEFHIACAGKLKGETDVLSRNALLRIIHRNKDGWFSAITKHQIYYVYRSNELLIVDNETDLIEYHESVHEFAFEYNKEKSQIAGLFKDLVNPLTDPPYESFAMQKYLTESREKKLRKSLNL